MLEQSVSEAQTSESRVSNLQNWISHVDEVLSEHLENDITLEDLPHDFQVHFLSMFFFIILILHRFFIFNLINLKSLFFISD